MSLNWFNTVQSVNTETWRAMKIKMKRRTIMTLIDPYVARRKQAVAERRRAVNEAFQTFIARLCAAFILGCALALLWQYFSVRYLPMVTPLYQEISMLDGGLLVLFVVLLMRVRKLF